MKAKRTILMLGIAAMLASCSNDDGLQETNESAKNVVTFTATLDDRMKTRAIGDDDNSAVDCAIVEVYSDSDAKQKVGESVKVYKGTDGKFTFVIPNLIARKEYTFLFFAWCHSDHYNVNDLKNVTFDTSGLGFCVAYSLATTLTPEEISQQGVQLKHATAKVTMQTTTALTASDEIFLYCPIYKSFNVLTNSATGTPDTETYMRVAGKRWNAGGYIRSEYVFGTNETQTVSIKYGDRPTRKVITNVPFNPNKHVIIKGDFKQIGLTDANISVTFDENWGDGATGF